MHLDLKFTLPKSVGLATYPVGAEFGPRFLRDFEFVWMVEGDAEYRWGARTFAAPEGSFVLCRPCLEGETDFFRWDPKRRTRHGFCHFTIERFPADWPPLEAWPFVRPPVEGDLCWALARHLGTWLEKGNRLQVELTLTHLLWTFVCGERGSADVPAARLPDPVERALARVQQALDEDASAKLTLAELARAAAVTPEHLCRVFAASTGRSPLETVRLARLDRAAVLVARSNFTFQRIASQCGFASPYHFSRAFKAAYGRAPSVIRKAVSSGELPPLPRLLRFARSTDPK
ncbi:MAG: AraC family transcriptional regulator [Planctomycetota bacterium]|nr:AraC family transcriptional regulator [Planctomycetota bacterium]